MRRIGGCGGLRGLGRGLAVVVLSAVVVAPPFGRAAFPGDSGKVVFVCIVGGLGEICVINPDGSGQMQLTTNSATDNYPAWSPDGTKIVFMSNRDGNSEIYAMDVDGGNETRITNNTVADDQPSWSPDGTKIVFTRAGSPGRHIWTMNADGTGESQLTNTSAIDSDPAWSPDGTKIAFVRGGGPPVPDIYVMNTDGTGQVNLTNSSGTIERNPSWSPDGAKIAFDVNAIVVMNANGTGSTQLTDGGEQDPAWAPDGTKIVFQDNATAEITTMNANGSEQSALTPADTVGAAPDWQPLVYDFTGFFAPVDNTPVLNMAKAGSAIPVKFSLGGDRGLSILAAGYPKSQPISCSSSSAYDGIEETVTAGSSSLSYDATTDRYNYVWKTDKAWANTCRKLIVRLNDGTEHIAFFTFKK